MFKALQRRRTPAVRGKKKGEPLGSPFFSFYFLLLFALNNALVFIIPRNTDSHRYSIGNSLNTITHFIRKRLALFATIPRSPRFGGGITPTLLA